MLKLSSLLAVFCTVSVGFTLYVLVAEYASTDVTISVSGVLG